MTPNYSRSGKNKIPLTHEEFIEGMKSGHFVHWKHRAFISLLYYTGIRVSKGLLALREHFKLTPELVYVDIIRRLKHSEETAPLPIRNDYPYVSVLRRAISETKEGARVFPYCRTTGYLIVRRVFYYPHHLRLTRITRILQKHNLPLAKSWTGLSLKALNFYVGQIDVKTVSEDLI